MFPAFLHHFLRPQTRLGLAHMRFAEEIHAQPRLADAAPDGQGQLATEETAMPVKVLALQTPADFELLQ